MEYNGEVARFDTKPLTLSLVKGILQKGMSEAVNYVNALIIAKERGYEISETVNNSIQDYSSLITVTVKNEKGTHTISGTVFGKKEFRIVNLDGNTTDFTPVGNMIWMAHEDRPGIVGKIGDYPWQQWGQYRGTLCGSPGRRRESHRHGQCGQ